MSALIFLVTKDSQLCAGWERQVPPGRAVIRVEADALPATVAPGATAVVVLDVAAEDLAGPALQRLTTILIGQPRSQRFEEARVSRRAKLYLSYDESLKRLEEVLPLVEEIAHKQSLLDLVAERARRTEPAGTGQRPGVGPPDSPEFWDFVEGALENIENRDRTLAEFRRASRTLLHASHAVFFLREPAGFRADRGTSFLSFDDPLIPFFEQHPTVIDGNGWENGPDPVAELAARNRLALWGARLLVPVHDNGRLLGLIAFGVRDDGRPYDERDRHRAVSFARLLRHCLVKTGQWQRLSALSDQAGLGSKYLPHSLVLAADENPPADAPVVVKDLVGRVRATGNAARVAPSATQPFRARAGVVLETGGTWATWEEASAEIQEASGRDRTGRKRLLRELALTLAHELGNALVSLATLRQVGGNTPPAPLLETAKGDIAKLEALNRQLGLMQTLHDCPVKTVDVRDLAKSVGRQLGCKVEVGADPIQLAVAPELIEFALRSIVEVVAENRKGSDAAPLVLQLRSTGGGEKCTALLSVQGRNLELEGILPEPGEQSVPNQGRLGILLAKEILRLHQGEIHGGPGMEGAEILFSIRSLTDC